MRACLRLLLLLAAVALGITPATAHGGYGGPADQQHCAPSASAGPADHDRSADDADAPHLSGHVAPLCLCALVTTLAAVAEPRPPRFVRAVPPRPDGEPLVGRALPPADRPPRV